MGGGNAPTSISLSITHHAMWRAAERFPWFDTTLIEGEVWDAFTNRRVSPHRPVGLRSNPDHVSLYAWTPDGLRVYALRSSRGNDNAFVVVTTLRAER